MKWPLNWIILLCPWPKVWSPKGVAIAPPTPRPIPNPPLKNIHFFLSWKPEFINFYKYCLVWRRLDLLTSQLSKIKKLPSIIYSQRPWRRSFSSRSPTSWISGAGMFSMVLLLHWTTTATGGSFGIHSNKHFFVLFWLSSKMKQCLLFINREEYQGVRSPEMRSEADFDPGAKYHIAANVEYIR